jgi:uncharacterized protein YecE (DUF72 family)
VDAAPPVIRYDPPAPLDTEYRVGLCAWQDKSMLEKGTFYPIKSMKAEERLWWYSQFFDCVEVNSTFYAPLTADNAVRWVKRTPAGFVFSVKAYALLTGHHLDAARLPEPLLSMLPAGTRPNARGQIENRMFPREAYQWAFETFREGLRPLADSGKLGYVLFQMARGSSTRRRRSTISRACGSACPTSPSPWSSGTPRGCPYTAMKSSASSPPAASRTCPSMRRGRPRAWRPRWR